MRCHICNKQLKPEEIQQDERDEWLPCSECLNEVEEAMEEDND